jgi:hypothetical protein
MKFILKHPYQLDSVNGVLIEDDVVRIRWSSENKVFSRNTFVTINVKGSKRKIYRILKGASTEKVNGSEVLVSYSSFKYLQAKADAELQIVRSTFWERNVLFYFSHPDPRKHHQVIRDFVVSFAAFVVSIVEILRYFGVQL